MYIPYPGNSLGQTFETPFAFEAVLSEVNATQPEGDGNSIVDPSLTDEGPKKGMCCIESVENNKSHYFTIVSCHVVVFCEQFLQLFFTCCPFHGNL